MDTQNLKDRATALQTKVESLAADAQSIAERASELITVDDNKRSAAALTAISLIKEAGTLLNNTSQALGFLTFEPGAAGDNLVDQLVDEAREMVTEMAEQMGIRPEVMPIFALDTAEIIVPAVETLVGKAKEKLSEAETEKK